MADDKVSISFDDTKIRNRCARSGKKTIFFSAICQTLGAGNQRKHSENFNEELKSLEVIFIHPEEEKCLAYDWTAVTAVVEKLVSSKY